MTWVDVERGRLAPIPLPPRPQSDPAEPSDPELMGSGGPAGAASWEPRYRALLADPEAAIERVEDF
jgi:hypothetical protein